MPSIDLKSALEQQYSQYQFKSAQSRRQPMKVLSALSCRAKSVLHPHKDFYSLFWILCLSELIRSIAALAKELPDLVESIVKLLGII
jgi:hypothetical protein